jgi:cytochrome c-type biogenesis protein CcmH
MFTTSTSFSVLGSELFVADHSQQVEQVELFEFDSLTQQKHAIALAKSLRCPQCQNQNLVESNSPMAMDLRLMVYQQVRAGKSDDEIVNFMTDRYGDFVRYKPGFGTNTAILWIGPVLILLFLILWMLRLVKKGPK